MKKIVMAALFCTVGSAIFATSQVPEVLMCGDTTNDLYTTPLESLFSAGSQKVFIKGPSSTACWRGYIGTWKIENDELYLVALQEGHPRTGAIPLDKVNPQWKSPVKAIWFSGTLRIGRGKILMGGMGFSETGGRHFPGDQGRQGRLDSADRQQKMKKAEQRFYSLYCEPLRGRNKEA